MKTCTIQITKCGDDCPYYEGDDINEHFGCQWTPAHCDKVEKDILGDDDKNTFPSFCPLPNEPKIEKD